MATYATQTLGPHHHMNELERARAGIDHRGQPLPDWAAQWNAFAAELAQAAYVAPIEFDKIAPHLDGDAICKRAAERQQDAQDRADEERDCNGNARRWE